MDALVDLMEGTYHTRPSATHNPDEPVLLDRRERVPVPALGRYIVYWQVSSGRDEQLYRQRLLEFAPATDGRIVQTTWQLRDAEDFVDAFGTPDRFAALTAADVEVALPDTCNQVWTRTDDSWHGRVDPESCRIWSERRDAWRHIGAEITVTPDGLWLAERGYDDDGNRVFGPPPGEGVAVPRVRPNSRATP